MHSLLKEQSIRSLETIQNAFFLELCPFFNLGKTLTIYNISVVTEGNLPETLSMCPLSKEQSILSRETIQNVFFRIMPLFQLFILYQAPQTILPISSPISRALAPTCGTLVYFSGNVFYHSYKEFQFLSYIAFSFDNVKISEFGKE